MGTWTDGMRLQWLILATFTFVTPAVISVQLRAMTGDLQVHPGQNVSILCRSDVPLHYCRIKLPGFENALTLSSRSKSTSQFAYHGAGLDKGECGATLFAVDDKVNGVIHCTAGTEEHTEEIADRMRVTVLRQAKTPYFTFVPAPSKRNPHVYRDDFIVRATCTAERGRPVAQITWYLDEEAVTKGVKPAIIEEDKDNLYTVKQEIARRLSWRDNGKRLRCVTRQKDVTAPTEVAVVLNVTYAPRSIKSPIKLYGFVINSTASLIVEVFANPQPKLTWMMADTEVGEGSKSSDGRLEVLKSDALGPGKWKTVFIINQLTEKDIDKAYILSAKNSEGEAKYHVIISTDAEPQGLSTEVSIAIGVAVFVLVALTIAVCVIIKRKRARVKTRLQES